MTGRDYRRVFLDRWPVIVAGLVVGLVVAGALALLVPARYSSNVTLFLAAPTRSTDANQTYQSDVLARERAKSYVPLVTEDRVAQEVAQRVGAGVTASQVAGSVVAVSPEDTPLLQITVSDSSPARAQAMAAATGDAMVALVRDLEVSSAGGAAPQVNASIVQPATFSTEKVSLGRAVQIAIGAVVGLVAGVGVALVLQLRDRSVDSADELQRETRLPVLAAIGTDRESRRRPTAWGPDATRARTEEYRRLRAALSFVGVGGEARVLMLASAREDEDITTTALNLAHVVAATGRSVVLVEADLRRPRLAVRLGGGSGGGLTRVLQGRAQVRVMLRRDPTGTFDVLVAGEIPADPTVLLSGPELPATLRSLAVEYQVVIVEVPPLLPVIDAALVARHVDEVVLVTARGRSSTDEALEALAVLRQAGATVVGTVFTGARGGPAPLRPPRGRTRSRESAPAPTAPPDEGDAPPRGSEPAAAPTAEPVSLAARTPSRPVPGWPVPLAHVTLPSQAGPSQARPSQTRPSQTRPSSGATPTPGSRSPERPSLSAPTVALHRSAPTGPSEPTGPAGTTGTPDREAPSPTPRAPVRPPSTDSVEAPTVSTDEAGSATEDPEATATPETDSPPDARPRAPWSPWRAR